MSNWASLLSIDLRPQEFFALNDKSDRNIMYDAPESISEHVGKFFEQLFGDTRENLPKWIFDDKYDILEYSILDGHFLAEICRNFDES